MSDASASAAICGLRQTILARLEQNEDFRALMALERALTEITIRGLRLTSLARLEQNEDFRALKGLEGALAEITEIKLPPAQHQATLAQAPVNREVPVMRPLTPAKQPNVRLAREASADFRTITGLSENSLHFG